MSSVTYFIISDGTSQTAEIRECGPDWELRWPLVILRPVHKLVTLLWAWLADLSQNAFNSIPQKYSILYLCRHFPHCHLHALFSVSSLLCNFPSPAPADVSPIIEFIGFLSPQLWTAVIQLSAATFLIMSLYLSPITSAVLNQPSLPSPQMLLSSYLSASCSSF
jgi:hypothetical protein